jgi:HK97 family phage prohead protease
MASNTEYKSWLSSEDETIVSLEKAQSGRTTLEDIADGLDEYKRLHIAGLASPAELVTLHRAFPDNVEYEEACEALKNDEGEFSFMVVGGPASVEVVDREGHLITTDALKKAFKKYMKNFRGRNVMVMHSDVQVGHALPVYISKAGNVFKSGVDDKGLFFIAELRDDTKISNRVRDQIEKGGMKSYSIAGSATKSKDIKKSDGSSILQVDDMELAEVTICEKGVNQNAHFELLKGDKAEGSCVDGSCLTKSHDPAPEPEIIAISKSEMPSFKNLFMSWITKEEKDSDKSTAMAIATAQAKKEGYKKFTDGSPGDNRRDKLAKEIKRSLKKAQESDEDTFSTFRGYYGDAKNPEAFTRISDDAGIDEYQNPNMFIDRRYREREGISPSATGTRTFDNLRTIDGILSQGLGGKAELRRRLEERDFGDRVGPVPAIKPEDLNPNVNLSEKSITKQLFLDKLKEIV